MSIFLAVAKYSPNYRTIKELTKQGVQGEIDWEKGFCERIKLLRGLEKHYFIRALEEMRIRPYSKMIIRNLKALGMKMGIISGGFDILADKVKNTLELDFAYSNKLVFKDGRFSHAIMNVTSRKEDILLSVAYKYGLSLEYTVVVVDGANDLGMAKAAGFSIGFNPSEIIRRHVNFVIDDGDFRKMIVPIKSYFNVFP